MTWLSAAATFQPALPANCEPTTDFLYRFSSTFHTCVPTPLALTSNALGTLSIVAWLFAQLPQIYKNWSISSTSGLSIFFLVEWCLGDCSNLLGALFTHQAAWQVAIGAYYVFVDLCLVGQWLWYEKLQHGAIVRRVWPKRGSQDGHGPEGSMQEMLIDGVTIHPSVPDPDRPINATKEQSKQPERLPITFRYPTFAKRTDDDEKPSSFSVTPRGTTIRRVGPSSPMPSPSPRTVLLIACWIAMAQASPMASHQQPSHGQHTTLHKPTSLENAGTILSWLSTFLYLGSRLPQLFKNYRRKSTAGLSPHLFMAAFCGNLFYSSALLTNPCVWSDFGPYGGNGWVGSGGSDRIQFVTAALPFFLGAAGVLGLDASVGLQFLLYRERVGDIIVLEEDSGHHWHWRRISGWMRGWVPSINEPLKTEESEALLQHHDGERHRGQGYGAGSGA